MLTAERLRELLDYDPETGIFTWRYGTAFRSKRKETRRAGGDNRGYVVIRVDGTLYRAHRMAWLYVHGRWPVCFIDHINRIRSDNRIANLREADNALNMQNVNDARADSNSGILGVGWIASKRKWRAQIGANGRNRGLGYFDTPEEAHEAYLTAKRRLHPGCTI